MDSYRLTSDRYVDLLRADSHRFASVLANAEEAAGVPSCPGWDAADLLWHLTEVQWFWSTIAAERLQDLSGLGERRPQRPSAYPDLLGLFEEISQGLVDVLASTDDDEPVYTWLPGDQTVGFIRRRQVHEVLIHRVDAEQVTGDRTALDPTLASDGVDEALQIMFGGIPGWANFAHEHGPVVVRASDTDASWAVDVGSQSGTHPDSGDPVEEPTLDVREVGAAAAEVPAVATVTAEAAALDCWLWGRVPSTAVSTSGDEAALTAFQGVIATGVE